jgi:hypothetical protein
VLVHEGDKDRRVTMLVGDVAPPAHIVSTGGAQRAVGLTIAATGLVGLGLGATFGGLALARHGDVTSVCPNDVCPSDPARDQVAGANADSQTFATISTVAFVAGAVLAATGLVLFLAAPRAHVVVGLGFVGGSF